MSTDGAESPSLNLNLRIYLIESRTFIRHVRHENKIVYTTVYTTGSELDIPRVDVNSRKLKILS